MLTPRELDEIVGVAPWIDLYRMEQRREDDFVFRYLANDAFDIAAETALTERLQEAIATRAVSVTATNYLPSDRGGKFISCLSAVAVQRMKDGVVGSA